MQCEFEKSSGRPVRAVDCLDPSAASYLRLSRVLLSYRASSVLFPLGINVHGRMISHVPFSLMQIQILI